MKSWKTDDQRPAFDYARQLTATYSKSFYLSARLLPEDRRWATFALYGFCRYADNLIDLPRERSHSELLAEAHELSEEVRRAYRRGESEHPIVKPFIATALTYDIPEEYPLDLIEGVKMDLTETRYASFEDLHLFAYRVAGVVGLMMTHVMGYKSDLAFDYAETLGIAMQLTNILRDIKEDKDMGRIYLPREEMAAFGVREDDILQERMSPGMRELVKAQVKRAHHLYEEAQPGIAMLSKESQFAIYAASRLYRGILYRIERHDYNPFKGRVFVPGKQKLAVLLNELARTRLDFMPQPELIPLKSPEFRLQRIDS